jgi:hypothetical protein
MNSLSLGVFMKNHLSARWCAEKMEWRFKAGDTHLAVKVISDKSPLTEGDIESIVVLERLLDEEEDGIVRVKGLATADFTRSTSIEDVRLFFNRVMVEAALR